MPVTIVGNNTPTAGGVVYGDGTNYASTAAGTSGQVLISGGSGAPSFSTNISGNATNVTGTVAVANGGTGATTLTANNVLLGNGTSALQVVAPGTNGNVLTSNGTTWTSAALPASGAMTLISTQNIASGSATQYITFSGLSTTYNAYMLMILSARGNASAYLDAFLQVFAGGSWITSNYITGASAVATSTLNITDGGGSAGGTSFYLTPTGNGSASIFGNELAGAIYLYNTNRTAGSGGLANVYISSTLSGYNGAGYGGIATGGGYLALSNNITQIRFGCNDWGTIYGTFSLYGITI